MHSCSDKFHEIRKYLNPHAKAYSTGGMKLKFFTKKENNN
ncbi:hypothetical protein ECDEC10C_6036 [Escherichia coli DEC10C]|nr:hypothetical protein ECDEC10C_6036 [Escherichia coli DEC10C]